MTAVLLLRREWEHDSVDNIARLSRHPFRVVRTGGAFPDNTNLIFRWGCTANTPRGVPVINSASHIHQAANKPAFRRILKENDLAPETFFSVDDLVDAIVDGNTTRGEWIVRPALHARGADMLLCVSANDLREAVRRFGPQSYISRKIEKVKEYRVLFVQGRVVQVVEKIPRLRERLNWGLGTFVNVRWGEWPMNVVTAARAAHGLSGLTFSAIDVIIDRANHPYILEANTGPELIGEYSQGVFAKAFDYIIDNNKDDIPVNGNTWQHLIHPAISNQAA